MLPLGFQLQAASAGQLFYELGLRDNDFPLALNGYPVTDIGEVLVALGELWYIEGETDYHLAVLRGSSVVTLHYSLN